MERITNNVDGAVTTPKQVGTGYFKVEGLVDLL